MAPISLVSASPVLLATPPDSNSGRISYITSSLTSITTCIISMLALAYLCAVLWTLRYSHQHLRPLNKKSGLKIQRFAPVIYVFIVLGSLIEVALGTWLLLQYRFLDNYPNAETRTGARILLASACWTTLTSGAYSLLFLHPRWSKHPVSSLGAQAVWVFVTWVLWIIGAGILNNALPSVLVKGNCVSVVYCGQIQALFAFAVLEIVIFSGAMATMMWLAWRSTRNA